jgi:hypothetical protein
MACKSSTTCRQTALINGETGLIGKFSFETGEQMMHGVHSSEFHVIDPVHHFFKASSDKAGSNRLNICLGKNWCQNMLQGLVI